jgi:hypothetical protein
LTVTDESRRVAPHRNGPASRVQDPARGHGTVRPAAREGYFAVSSLEGEEESRMAKTPLSIQDRALLSVTADRVRDLATLARSPEVAEHLRAVAGAWDHASSRAEYGKPKAAG